MINSKKNKRLNSFLATLLSFTIALALHSCDSDEAPDSTVESDSFGLLIDVGVDYEPYFLAADDLMNGTLSIVGQGSEISGTYGLRAGDHYYAMDWGTNLLIQFDYSEGKLEEIGSISPEALGVEGEILAATDTEIILTSWTANEEGEMKWVIISIPDYNVTASGTFTVPTIGRLEMQRRGSGVVDGDKFVVGTRYSFYQAEDVENEIEEIWEERQIATSLILDYPSFENPRLIETDQSMGLTCGYVGSASFMDERGDVYQHNIKSIHWGHELERFDSRIFKITNGEYDESYDLVIDDAFSKNISIYNIIYAGNGIAFGIIMDEDYTTEWDKVWTDNINMLAKIDVWNRTVTKMNIPQAQMMSITSSLVDGDKFYIPVNVAGEGTSIYQININGDGNSFTKGATIEGDNINVVDIFKINE